MTTTATKTTQNLPVTIVSAQGLAAKDRRMFGKNTSDPYVVGDLHTSAKDKDGMVTQNKEKLFQTTTIPKTLDPVWNESFSCSKPVVGLTFLALSLFVEDKIGKDNPLGVIQVSLTKNMNENKTIGIPPASAKGAKGKSRCRFKTIG